MEKNPNQQNKQWLEGKGWGEKFEDESSSSNNAPNHPLVRVVRDGIYPVIKVAFGWQTSEGAGTRAAVDRLV